jgi:hypothetical protein
MKKRGLSPQILQVLVVLQLLLLAAIDTAYASPVDGSWIYISSGDLLSTKVETKSEKEWFMQAMQRKIMTSQSCLLDLHPPSTATLDILFKDDQKNDQRRLRIKDIIASASGMVLEKKLFRYTVESHDCSGNIGTLFVQDNKMVAIAGGNHFYTYARAKGQGNGGSSVHSLRERVSSFPFSPGNFSALCEPYIRRIKGVPQATTACASLFFPYIAKNGDGNFLANLIGHYHYIKGNANYFNDYDDPFANGLHPVYMVLPPLNDVFLVRVEDLEGNADQRDMYSGAYLSIKKNAVVDQLQAGCIMTAGYICLDGNAKPIARMLPSGRFERFR